jgi:TrmH family RNA methyltransferase
MNFTFYSVAFARYTKRPMKNIRIVLVETSHPGNIGSVARAMKTMNLHQLYLVSPWHFPSDEATALAAGAADVLERAIVVPSLAEALAGCALVLGTSARNRSLPMPLLNPRQAANVIHSESQQHPVAIVFGREKSGLHNNELDLCHQQIVIPTNPDYGSLNLAQAVQIQAYELNMLNQVAANLVDEGDPLASADELQGLIEHAERVLLQVEFYQPQQPGLLKSRLLRLLSRCRLTRPELNILRGICKAVLLNTKRD